ncbi:hypothetical protein [Amycolatopsis palatopharyngis]|uniref:hypothetical protein n=1 Tax=Amycolatopsis palatopharyngis TaxID=187982 RepID=UPI0013BEA2DC|nr:hypothetical protein [Amycolatopsis palatopharyngis]
MSANLLALLLIGTVASGTLLSPLAASWWHDSVTAALLRAQLRRSIKPPAGAPRPSTPRACRAPTRRPSR